MTDALILGAAVVVLLIIAGMARYYRHLGEDRRARYAPLRAALAVEDDAALRALEVEHGFSGQQDYAYPEATRPEGTSGSRWLAVRARPRPTPLAPRRKGVIVAWNEADGMHLSMAQVELPPERRAETRAEVAWIAFTYAQRIEAAYTYEGVGALDSDDVFVERVDARLVSPDGVLLARGTVESVPPPTSRSAPDGFPLALTDVADLVVALVDAAERAPAGDPSRPPPPVCIADRIPDEPLDDEAHVSCTQGATEACLAHCRAGHPRSCAEAAYTVERDDRIGAQGLYRLGCLGGDTNACTNWGSGLLVDHGDDEEALTCAARVFERTCALGEHFGCGMLASALSRGAGVAADPERAGRVASDACDELGAFSCQVLGQLREQGILGDEARVRAPEAYQRACDTGYAPACAIAGDADPTAADEEPAPSAPPDREG